MSTNIVLPELAQWVQNHISAIIQAQTQADLEDAVDAFLAKNATIVVNGAQLSQADFIQQLSSENFAEEGATVTFNNSLQVPATAGDNFTAGSVGLFYTADIAQRFVIRDAPITSQVIASLNVVVGPDPTIPKPPPSPIHGFFDPRRVTSLNEVRIQAPLTATVTTQ
ncbi:hypothetical protein BDN70DRAFT_811482 [Pholiota conissans]|uniref:Uncharacterized protein n=1 Tax=Pholiota conissans TaxID=109636 RepID=A0A9P5YYC1_9AGAR|nr:hypothetical protein BDN70DRAFT_811482 [Pholiota conissans]